MEGTICSNRSSIQTVSDAEDFAGDMLSPFFDPNEIRAIFIKFSPDIIAQAGRDNMDMTLNLGGNYAISIQGPPLEIVRFDVKQIGQR